MAFDNVTFFELHLDDARFGERGDAAADDEAARGPDAAGSDRREHAGESDTTGEAESGRSGPGVGGAVVVLALFAVSAAVARRLAGRRGREESDGDDAELHVAEGDDAATEPVELSD